MGHSVFTDLYSDRYENKKVTDMVSISWDNFSGDFSAFKLGTGYCHLDWRNFDWSLISSVEQVHERRIWIWG